MSELDPEKILKEHIRATLARLKEVRAIIAKNGVEVRWGRGTKPNPFLRYEQEQRILLIRLLRALPLAPMSGTFEAEIERLMADEGP